MHFTTMHFRPRWTWTVAMLSAVAPLSAAVAGDESAPRQGGFASAPTGPVIVGYGPFTPGVPREAPPLLLAAEKGGYRVHIIGPDGRLYEHQVSGGLSSEQLDRVKAKLKELQAAAGDPAAVQRISQELLQELTASAEDQAAVGGEQLHYGIGVSLAPEVPASLRAHLQLGADEGLLVGSVAPGSPADKAGIKEHDLLLKVGETPLKTPSQLVEAVQQAGQESQPVKLELLSGGERRAVEVTPTRSDEIGWKMSVLKEGRIPLGIPMTGYGEQHRFLIQKVPPGVVPGVPGLGHPMPGYPPGKSPAGDDAVKKLEERIRALEDRLSKLAAQLEERPVKEKEAAPPRSKE